MTKQHKKDPIPENVSREELAKFWDTHDFTDYLDEMKPVKVKFAKNLSHIVAVRLDTDTLNKLETQAEKKGIGTTTLIRMWLLEHLEEQEKQQYPPAP
jgi:predicted DNA binding CopG/RHH family protein